MNLQKMMQQAQQLQTKMGEMQAQLAEQETDGSAGGGMVSITLNGKGAIVKLNIDDSLMEKSEKEVLEDLIIAAYNDAKQKVEETFSDQMGKLASNMGLPPGMKLPF